MLRFLVHGMARALMSYILLSVLLFLSFAGATDLKSIGQSQHDLTGTLLQRNMNGNVVLQRAAVILRERLSDSTPLQDAAMDLLRMCKSSKDTTNPKISKEIEVKAKNIYAVRAAVVDISSAAATTPQSCLTLTEPSQRSWYQTSRSSLSDPSNLPSTRELDACVKELFQVDNMWTSFTNHRQDANTLCEVPGVENASRMILDLLNDVNSIIPDWVDTFRSEQETYTVQLEMRKAHLQQIHEMEQQRRTDLEEERLETKEKLADLDRIWQTQVDKMSTTADAKMTDLDGRVGQMHQDLIAYSQDFVAARQDHASLIDTYQVTVLEALALQQNGITNMDSAVAALIASYEEANGVVVAQSEVLSAQLQSAMKDAAARQAQLSISQSEFAANQEVQLQRQKESLAFTEQLETKVANKIGEVNNLLDSIAPAMRAVNAVVTGKISTRSMLICVCGAITLLLTFLGFCRHALIFVCFVGKCCLLANSPLFMTDPLSVLGWTVPPIVLEIYVLLTKIPWTTLLIMPNKRWSVGLLLITISALVYALRFMRSRRTRPTVIRNSQRILSTQIYTPPRKSREVARTFRRAQTVEPGMIGYY